MAGIRKRSAAALRVSDERLEISRGALGPLTNIKLDVRPLTVLIGPQGAGKSLIAQLLYFFRSVRALAEFDLSGVRPDEGREREPKRVIKRVVDGLRSANRSFAAFATPSASIAWEGPIVDGRGGVTHQQLGMNLQGTARQIHPRRGLLELVDDVAQGQAARWRDGRQPLRERLSTVFLPSERVVFSNFPRGGELSSQPLLLEVFGTYAWLAAQMQSGWPGRRPTNSDARWVRAHLENALGGRAVLRGEAWKWQVRGDVSRSIDLDMASSGQRANWAVSTMLQVLLESDGARPFGRPFTLYVEEPEIHLHPRAQQAIAEALALFVNRGFRVVLTTHSLTVLYALNNLMAASQIGAKVIDKRLPLSQLRIDPSMVAAYLVDGGSVSSLMSDGTGRIDERQLGNVSDALASDLNRIDRAIQRGG